MLLISGHVLLWYVAPVLSPISAVLFDFGLVLTKQPNPAAWKRMHGVLALTPERFYKRYWARRHDYDRGALTGEAYWSEIADASDDRPLPTEILEILLAADVDLWTDINEPMLAWAQHLQRRGIRTGILSNMGDRMTAGLLRKLPWLAGFDHHTWSHALGIAKPEPAIYRHAAEGLGTSLKEILFVDDKPENIAAAQDAGMNAIPYRNWPDFLTTMQAAGYADLLDNASAASGAPGPQVSVHR